MIRDQNAKENIMTDTRRLKYLRVALVIVGICALGLYPLMLVWPSGWAWPDVQSDYAMMIAGIYATLGVFLLLAARKPLANLSLIWFAVWSSIVHAGIMAIQALTNPQNAGHLIGDIPALLIIAAVLAILTPRHAQANQT
jgi:hypothetical protein